MKTGKVDGTRWQSFPSVIMRNWVVSGTVCLWLSPTLGCSQVLPRKEVLWLNSLGNHEFNNHETFPQHRKSQSLS